MEILIGMLLSSLETVVVLGLAAVLVRQLSSSDTKLLRNLAQKFGGSVHYPWYSAQAKLSFTRENIEFEFLASGKDTSQFDFLPLSLFSDDKNWVLQAVLPGASGLALTVQEKNSSYSLIPTMRKVEDESKLLPRELSYDYIVASNNLERARVALSGSRLEALKEAGHVRKSPPKPRPEQSRKTPIASHLIDRIQQAYRSTDKSEQEGSAEALETLLRDAQRSSEQKSAISTEDIELPKSAKDAYRQGEEASAELLHETEPGIRPMSLQLREQQFTFSFYETNTRAESAERSALGPQHESSSTAMREELRQLERAAALEASINAAVSIARYLVDEGYRLET